MIGHHAPTDIAGLVCALPLDREGRRCELDHATTLRLCGALDCADVRRERSPASLDFNRP